MKFQWSTTFTVQVHGDVYLGHPADSLQQLKWLKLPQDDVAWTTAIVLMSDTLL